MIKLVQSICLFFLFVLLAFPLFYFVYKYGDPEPIAHDFFQYYRLYKDWDIGNVNSAFNMRLAGSAIVHLFYEAGLSYNTGIAFDKYLSWGFDKRVFFCAVFFNFLSVSATCTVLFFIIKEHLGDVLISFTASLIYLLGFGTMFYAIMPLTDAFSILLFTLILRAYLRRSYLVLIPLSICMLQREYIFMALGLMALLDLIWSGSGYYTIVLAASAVLFSVYYILRNTVFSTPVPDAQASPEEMLEKLFIRDYRWGEYIRQTVLTLNIFILYLGLIAWKKMKRMPTDRNGFVTLMLLFLQINIISLVAGHGNNTGRYFYIVVPFVIYSLAVEMKSLGWPIQRPSDPSIQIKSDA